MYLTNINIKIKLQEEQNKMKSQIPNFKQYLISLSKSPNTIRNYTADVTHYFEMFDTINRENILKYKEKISGLATTTINCKLSSLKSFNEYLLSQNLVKSIFVLKQISSRDSQLETQQI